MPVGYSLLHIVSHLTLRGVILWWPPLSCPITPSLFPQTMGSTQPAGAPSSLAAMWAVTYPGLPPFPLPGIITLCLISTWKNLYSIQQASCGESPFCQTVLGGRDLRDEWNLGLPSESQNCHEPKKGSTKHAFWAPVLIIARVPAGWRVGGYLSYKAWHSRELGLYPVWWLSVKGNYMLFRDGERSRWLPCEGCVEGQAWGQETGPGGKWQVHRAGQGSDNRHQVWTAECGDWGREEGPSLLIQMDKAITSQTGAYVTQREVSRDNVMV